MKIKLKKERKDQKRWHAAHFQVIMLATMCWSPTQLCKKYSKNSLLDASIWKSRHPSVLDTFYFIRRYTLNLTTFYFDYPPMLTTLQLVCFSSILGLIPLAWWSPDYEDHLRGPVSGSNGGGSLKFPHLGLGSESKSPTTKTHFHVLHPAATLML